MRRISCCLFLLFLVSTSNNLFGQRNAKGPAYTEPPKGDVSFQLMGEFVGPISTGENQYEPLALQIRCVGGDNFEAVSYKGGLPGQAKHQSKMTKMIGRRSGDFVVLSGGPWAIFVERDHCLILDRTGKRIGRLERVNRQSPSMGAKPPTGAVIIFDGTNTDQFVRAEMTEDGLLMQGADLKPMFQDFNLHAEFRIPYMPQAQGQQRGNSGFYLQSRYECQVLDSFALEPLINGLGALYQNKKPDVNMALPPLVWQTYDIQFTAPRWAADGSKISNARISSWINGVKVQNDFSLPNKTGAGKIEEPVLLPSKIQDHGDPVRFRNIWIVDRGTTHMPKFPIFPAKEAPKKAEPKKEEPAKKPEPKPEAKKADSKPAEPKENNKDAKKTADDKKEMKSEKAEAPKAQPKKAESKKATEPKKEAPKKKSEAKKVEPKELNSPKQKEKAAPKEEPKAADADLSLNAADVTV